MKTTTNNEWFRPCWLSADFFVNPLSHLQTTKEEDEMRLRELEKNYGKEKKRADALQKELETLKV